MMDTGQQLEQKLNSLVAQLEVLSRQISIHDRFLKRKFQREFEEFVEEAEGFETSGSGASGDEDTPNVSIAADADSVNSAETEEACGLQGTSLTNQQDEQGEDFEEEKFDMSGFVEPAEPEYSDFCYAEFANAMRLNEKDANKEGLSESEASTSRAFDDFHPPSGGTSAAAIPSSSSNSVRRLQQEKQVEEEGEERLPKRPSPTNSRKRRRNSTERSPERKETGTPTVDNSENVRSDEDRGDSLDSGETSSDSSSSEEDSDYETKIRRLERRERRERLRGQRPCGSSTFLLHEQNEPVEKRFQCSECSKRFVDARDLRDHKMIHVFEIPHDCSNC